MEKGLGEKQWKDKLRMVAEVQTYIISVDEHSH